MGTEPKPGKPPAPATAPAPSPTRRSSPRSLGDMLPAITRAAFKRRSPAGSQLMSDWHALAGPTLAAMAQPKRCTGGTLLLAVSGPAALELQHRTAELIARLNGALGRPLIERVRFVQEDIGPASTSVAPRSEPEPVPVTGLGEGELAAALARLGGRIAARSRT